MGVGSGGWKNKRQKRKKSQKRRWCDNYLLFISQWLDSHPNKLQFYKSNQCFVLFVMITNRPILPINMVQSRDWDSEGGVKRQIETSLQRGRKKGAVKYTAVSPWRRGRLKKKKQLWRNNFLAIHQWAHVDPIDKLLITKSIAMNFHSCQSEGLPGEWSPRDFVLTFRTPSSPSSSSHIDPHLSSLLHNTALPQLRCLKAKARHQHFHFSATHKTRESGPVTQVCIDQSATGPASSKGACQ